MQLVDYWCPKQATSCTSSVPSSARTLEALTNERLLPSSETTRTNELRKVREMVPALEGGTGALSKIVLVSAWLARAKSLAQELDAVPRHRHLLERPAVIEPDGIRNLDYNRGAFLFPKHIYYLSVLSYSLQFEAQSRIPSAFSIFAPKARSCTSQSLVQPRIATMATMRAVGQFESLPP